MKFFHLSGLAVAIGMAGSAQAVWNPLPTPDAQPVNIASKALYQTSLSFASNGIVNAPAMVGDNVVALIDIPAGKSEAVLQLPRQMVINSIGFGNVGFDGKLGVAASKDNKEW